MPYAQSPIELSRFLGLSSETQPLYYDENSPLAQGYASTRRIPGSHFGRRSDRGGRRPCGTPHETVHSSPSFSSPQSTRRKLLTNRRRSRDGLENLPGLLCLLRGGGDNEGTKYRSERLERGLADWRDTHCAKGGLRPRAPALPLAPAPALDKRQHRRDSRSYHLSRRSSSPPAPAHPAPKHPDTPFHSSTTALCDSPRASFSTQSYSETKDRLKSHTWSVPAAPAFPAPTVDESPPRQALQELKVNVCSGPNARELPVPSLSYCSPRLIRSDPGIRPDSRMFSGSRPLTGECKSAGARNLHDSPSTGSQSSGGSGGLGGGRSPCSEMSNEQLLDPHDGPLRECNGKVNPRALSPAPTAPAMQPIAAIERSEIDPARAMILQRKVEESSGDGFIAFALVTPDGDGPRQYKCLHCKKIFGQRSNVVMHVRTHTGDKPFKCSLCDRGFAQRSNMRRHMTARHRSHNVISKRGSLRTQNDAIISLQSHSTLTSRRSSCPPAEKAGQNRQLLGR